jgi:hypothetical protein
MSMPTTTNGACALYLQPTNFCELRRILPEAISKTPLLPPQIPKGKKLLAPLFLQLLGEFLALWRHIEPKLAHAICGVVYGLGPSWWT